ncbi:hypothetical protein E2P81_ATG10034 [Venturia nashicola]|uniref:Uncharacterized protein n=1 Tax=Venturia nashicola TaxID=86259 RepID=A0A4Z1NJM6_9PEZI|nr:hypothetical protein E6O75_ATG10254 [Venturia nashicola]TLD14739.1 hypothetical protein E2P81_ATG10034 [Venturia nashicola]
MTLAISSIRRTSTRRDPFCRPGQSPSQICNLWAFVRLCSTGQSLRCYLDFWEQQCRFRVPDLRSLSSAAVAHAIFFTLFLTEGAQRSRVCMADVSVAIAELTPFFPLLNREPDRCIETSTTHIHVLLLIKTNITVLLLTEGQKVMSPRGMAHLEIW